MREKNRTTRLILALMAMVVLPLLSGCEEHHHWNPVIPATDRIHVEYEQFTPSAAGVAALDVRTTSGSIEIDGSTQSRLSIRVRKEVRASTLSEAKRIASLIRINVERTGDELRVFSDLPTLPRHTNVEVSYDIQGPRGMGLRLRTVNGETRITGTAAWVQAVTGNGRILATLDELQGKGTFTVGNGTVDARVAAGNPALEIGLANGTVDLGVQPDYSGSLDLQTANGSVRCDLPLAQTSQRRSGRIVGVLGDGGAARIEVRAANARVRLAGYDPSR